LWRPFGSAGKKKKIFWGGQEGPIPPQEKGKKGGGFLNCGRDRVLFEGQEFTCQPAKNNYGQINGRVSKNTYKELLKPKGNRDYRLSAIASICFRPTQRPLRWKCI